MVIWDLDKSREIDLIGWDILENNLKQTLSLKIIVKCTSQTV
jgi:hypothetical protein